MIARRRPLSTILRAALLSIGMLTIACAGEGPMVSVILSAEDEAAQVQRLTLIVRAYGEQKLGFRQDVYPGDPPMCFPAAIVPGVNFYVWVQGWTACAANATTCVPDQDSKPGTCVCVDNTTEEMFALEACSHCFRTTQDVQIP